MKAELSFILKKTYSPFTAYLSTSALRCCDQISLNMWQMQFDKSVLIDRLTFVVKFFCICNNMT